VDKSSKETYNKIKEDTDMETAKSYTEIVTETEETSSRAMAYMTQHLEDVKNMSREERQALLHELYLASDEKECEKIMERWCQS
jgi:hypothetical protein